MIRERPISNPEPNPQPNLQQPDLPPVFWLLALLTGALAGIVSALLVRLLRLIERLAYNAHTGSFLSDVSAASPTRKITCLFLAGVHSTAVSALIGAGAVLAAASGGPISSLIFLDELTHRVDALTLPIFLAIAGATLTQRLFERRSIYSVRD